MADLNTSPLALDREAKSRGEVLDDHPGLGVDL
jgi:hypothetical protein